MSFFVENKQTIHMLFELLAIIIVLPFLIYLLYAKSYCFTGFEKFLMVLIAASTLIVDGGLLYLNVKQ